jgi:hypothetical protein
MNEFAERLDQLEERVEQIRPKKRSFWDIFQIIGTLLIPASITVVGYIYTETSKEKEIEIARINSQVNQAQLISTFMEPLMSGDTVKKEIAMNAILIGIPQKGKQIVEVLSKTGVDRNTQKLAENALDSRRTALIKQLYASDKSQRVSAAQDLITSWRDDPRVVQEMVAAAKTSIEIPDYYPDQRNGLYNCMIVLNQMNPNVLKRYGEELKTLFQRIPNDYGQTRQLASEIATKNRL